MTLIAGFKCANGVLIGADSEINQGNVKRYEDKLFPIRTMGDESDTGIVIAGAGDFEAISHCVQLLRERFEDEQQGTMRGMKTMERYGFVQLNRGARGSMIPRVPYQRISLILPLSKPGREAA